MTTDTYSFEAPLHAHDLQTPTLKQPQGNPAIHIFLEPSRGKHRTMALTNQGPRRIGQWLYLKPESIDEYKKCHAVVWPEVLEQIKESNVRDYSIFLSLTPRPTLFASFKYTGTAFDADMARMAANPKVQEWWRMTDGMQESPVEGAVGSKDGPGWWGQTEEVFYVD